MHPTLDVHHAVDDPQDRHFAPHARFGANLYASATRQGAADNLVMVGAGVNTGIKTDRPRR